MTIVSCVQESQLEYLTYLLSVFEQLSLDRLTYISVVILQLDIYYIYLIINVKEFIYVSQLILNYK